jgi:nicotinate phosphoribosyltransferase
MSDDFDEANRRTFEKIEMIHQCYNEHGLKLFISEFGGRRRHSVEAQANLLDLFKHRCIASQHGYGLVGTSNVMFAKMLGLKAIGTMAHEWLQAHQALYRVADSQFMALENWAKEYRGDLGIALSDVIGLKYFLNDFDMYFAKLFDGTRQDSGDPFEYGRALVQHYKKMSIDPMTKTIVFSDGLTVEKAIEISRTFKDNINCSFGIGTHLTNDFGFKALQLVLKMTRCNNQPVAKLSDSPGKSMCNDESYKDYVRKVFKDRLSK